MTSSTDPPPGEPLADAEASRAETEAEVAAAAELRPPPTCPYLIDAEGLPTTVLGPGNRCGAVDDETPLSQRQQSIVCLAASYQDCPRYLRATLVVPVTPFEAPPPRALPRATIGAWLVLALSVVVAVGYVFVNGGISVPVAAVTPGPSPSAVGAASHAPSAAAGSARPSASPAASVAASTGPSPSPASSAQPSPAASASPEPQASASPAASPSPVTSPSPAASPTPRPSSDRYDLLVPCPDKPDCYIYTVRSGDNLVSIANYFGVSLETVHRLNPWTRSSGLRPGRELVLPPPTR